MKRKHLRFGIGFRVSFGTKRAQAAEMVIAPGSAEGSATNRHRGADQWLFVVDGRGTARINGRRYPLRAGTLLVIERGDRHEIRNDGRTPLRTLNLYLPLAYTSAGGELPAAKS
jgi:mannose-6-phosphate isomerase-like protein (cupin superfamily)